MPAVANDELARALARGRAAWPGVAVSAGELAPLLDGAAGSAHAEDLYLACACARGDGLAIELFEARVLAQLDGALRRLRLGTEALVEVRQRVRAHLLAGLPPRIALYRGRGPLVAWVRIVAVRMALQLDRRERAEVRRAERFGHEPLSPALDPALELLRARHQGELRAAFTAALRALTPQQRNLLQLHLLEELSLSEIGAMHGVSKSSAARWVAEAKAELDLEVRRHLRAALGLGEPELESLIVALQSRLDLSVERLLAGAG